MISRDDDIALGPHFEVKANDGFLPKPAKVLTSKCSPSAMSPGSSKQVRIIIHCLRRPRGRQKSYRLFLL